MSYIAREEDYLAHHGIKGMRWGVRKSRPTSGGIKGKKSKKQVQEETLKKFSAYRSATQAECDSGKLSYTKGYERLREAADRIEDKKTRKKAVIDAINFAAHNTHELSKEEFAEAKKKNPNLKWDEYFD